MSYKQTAYSSAENTHHLLGFNGDLPLAYSRGPKIAVIDDDPDFGRLIVHLGIGFGLDITHFESLSELGSVGQLGKFDGVVLDYYLAEMTGVEIACYIDSFFPNLPAVLTSGNTYLGEMANLPNCVEGFVSKQNGPIAVIKAVQYAVKSRQLKTDGNTANVGLAAKFSLAG